MPLLVGHVGQIERPIAEHVAEYLALVGSKHIGRGRGRSRNLRGGSGRRAGRFGGSRLP